MQPPPSICSPRSMAISCASPLTPPKPAGVCNTVSRRSSSPSSRASSGGRRTYPAGGSGASTFASSSQDGPPGDAETPEPPAPAASDAIRNGSSWFRVTCSRARGRPREGAQGRRRGSRRRAVVPRSRRRAGGGPWRRRGGCGATSRARGARPGPRRRPAGPSARASAGSRGGTDRTIGYVIRQYVGRFPLRCAHRTAPFPPAHETTADDLMALYRDCHDKTGHDFGFAIAAGESRPDRQRRAAP